MASLAPDAPPTVRIIVPPTSAVAIVVTLPEPLATDARAHYADLAADHKRYGFAHLSFDEWVQHVLANEIYRGPRALGAGDFE